MALESHLLQMRGLKQMQGDVYERKVTSHLLQMRGLKQNKSNVLAMRI